MRAEWHTPHGMRGAGREKAESRRMPRRGREGRYCGRDEPPALGGQSSPESPSRRQRTPGGSGRAHAPTSAVLPRARDEAAVGGGRVPASRTYVRSGGRAPIDRETRAITRARQAMGEQGGRMRTAVKRGHPHSRGRDRGGREGVAIARVWEDFAGGKGLLFARVWVVNGWEYARGAARGAIDLCGYRPTKRLFEIYSKKRGFVRGCDFGGTL